MRCGKRFKKFQLMLSIGIILCATYILSPKNDASANNSGVGTTVTGTSCYYWSTCKGRGLAWAAYRLIGPLNGSNIHMGYTSGTGGPVNFSGCDAGQILYNYGFIAFQNDSEGKGTSTNQQIATASRDYKTSYLEYYPGQLYNFDGAYPTANNTFKGYYDIKDSSYVTEEQALKVFDNMVDYYKRKNQSVPGNSNRETVSWFCFDPDAYIFNASEVKSTNRTTKQTASAKIMKQGTGNKKEASELTANIGETVELQFNHDILADYNVVKQYTWRIDKSFPSDTTAMNITSQAESLSGICNKPSTTKGIMLSQKTNSLILEAEKSYASETSYACHRNPKDLVNTTYDVTFKKAGTYNFCQKLVYVNENNKIGNTTEVCQAVTVNPAPVQSYTKANASSADQNFNVDTGIVTGTVTKTSDTILKVQENQEFTLTFESEIFSKEEGKIISWDYGLRKNFANKNITWKSWDAKVMGKSKKPASSPDNTTYAGGTNISLGIIKNATYYFASKSPLVKNEFTMSIKKEGDYLFCQKAKTTDGSTSSEVCIKVQVTAAPPPPCDDCSCKDCPPDTPPPPVSPGGCSSHTPGSWDSSNEKSGTTSTWSGVASNVFTNIDNQTSIWAKPGDVITFKHCYFPGAQTVRKTTPGTDSEPKSYPEERDPLESETTLSSPAITEYPSTYSYIPKPTVVVESSNNFSISTDYPSLFSTGISYSLTGSGFSGSGPSFSGAVGKKDGAQVIANNSAGLKVAPNAVGKTITQSIGSNVGTTSVTGHSSWTWNYSWNWQYTCIKCALDQQKVNSCIADKTTACDGSTKGNCNPTKIRNACTSDDANKVDVKKTAYGYGYGSGTHYYNDGTVGTFYTPSSYTSYNGSSTSASVRIPYNYKTEVQEPEFSNDKIYAGQTFGVGTVETDVLKRINSTLQGEYATKTPETTIKLYSFYSNSLRGGGNEQAYSGNRGDCSYYNGYGYTACNELSSYTTTLNNGYDVNGSIENISHFASSSYAIPDIPAGYYFCVAASAWPAESANDTDMGLTGNSKAYYSKPFCKTVNKKPIFEVWGGNLYVAGGVKASYALKNNLSGSTEFTYQPNIFSSNIAFPSWAEYSVVAGKNINTLASGSAAAGGKRVGNSNTPCKFSPLTMSNSDCKNGSTSATLGNYSGKTQPKTVSETAQGIRKLFVDSGEVKTGAKFGSNASIDLSAASSYIQNASGTRYTYVDGNAYLTASRELEPNITHVIYATGDVIINSNITYTQGGYTDISQVPQYIIISDRNLYIAGHVSTLHAQLIFDKGTIYTCASGTTRITDPANPICSNQLRTIGTIVAQKLKLDRTYGAATGERSSWPAEILDAGLTTMLWSGSSESEAPTLHTVYTKEVSPRF